jgi:hypothetical protein
LTGELLEVAVTQAFIDADLNQDKMISFDEFVNSYSYFLATKNTHPNGGNTLFYPFDYLDPEMIHFKNRPSWHILNLLNYTNIYYANFYGLNYV